MFSWNEHFKIRKSSKLGKLINSFGLFIDDSLISNLTISYAVFSSNEIFSTSNRMKYFQLRIIVIELN